MLTKTVLGRKSLNATLRHLKLHGQIEAPCEYRQKFEHSIVKQLHIDGKVMTSRNGRGEIVIVLRDGTLYDEEYTHDIEPLVVHLALENPRNEHFAKVFRKNHTVPELNPVIEDPNEIFTDLD